MNLLMKLPIEDLEKMKDVKNFDLLALKEQDKTDEIVQKILMTNKQIELIDFYLKKRKKENKNV